MLYIISGEINSGKTSMLKRIQKVYGGDGVWCHKSEDALGRLNYDLVRFSTNKSYNFLREKGGEYQKGEIFERFWVAEEGISELVKWIRTLIKQKQSPIYLDEIGQLEFRYQKGFYPLLEELKQYSRQQDIYIVVKQSSLENIKEYFVGEEYRVIFPDQLAIIVMAAGYSRRMGEDKLKLEIEGKSVLKHILDKVNQLTYTKNLLITREGRSLQELQEEYHNIREVNNLQAYKGISESIKTGVREANSLEAQGYMFIPADQIGLTIKTIERLIVEFYHDSNSIIIPYYNGGCGAPAIFPNRYSEKLLALEGDGGGKKIWSQNIRDVRKVPIEDKWESYDVDTKEDYQEYIKYKD